MRRPFFQNYMPLKTAAILLIFGFISSCGNKEAQSEALEYPKPEVDFYQASNTAGQVDRKYPGVIEGSVNVDIKAQVSGYLEAIYVKEGQFVTKGQALFKIKGDVYAEQVNSSRAAYRSALANLSNAKLEVEKIRPLVEGKVFSDMQLKTAQANYEAAQSQAAQAKAALASSQINSDFSLIKAPVSGYISRIPNRIGNLVTPSDTIPLTVLSEIKDVYVYFSLSEADYLGVFKDKNKKHSVTLILADGSEYERRGTLETASGNVDRTTGTIAMKAVFANPDRILKSGGSAGVVLKSDLDSVITVPMSSVKDIQDKFFVFILKGAGKVAMVPVEIAGSSGDNYFVKSGVKAGDKVALNGIDVLVDGMDVIAKVDKNFKAANK